MKISRHACQRYSERTHTDPIESYRKLSDDLSRSRMTSITEMAANGIRIERKPRKTHFITWFNETSHQPLCGVVTDNVLVTVIARPPITQGEAA